MRFFRRIGGGDVRQSNDSGDSGLCCQRRRTTRPKLPVFGGIIISVEDFAWSLIIVKDAENSLRDATRRLFLHADQSAGWSAAGSFLPEA